MFAVIELQESQGLLQHIVSVHQTLREAESKYHTVLAAAAQSEIPVHSAVLLSGSGTVIRSESYTNGGENG